MVEREVLPRLKANDYVILDLELNAALLATETAVCLDKLVRLDVSRQPKALAEDSVWTEAAD
jgi:hypothetical protein